MLSSKFVETIVNKYGLKTQKVVAIEELSELSKEITKDIRGKLNREHLVEELSDVTIVLDELKVIYNISDTEIKKVRKYKINRLKENLKKD